MLDNMASPAAPALESFRMRIRLIVETLPGKRYAWAIGDNACATLNLPVRAAVTSRG